MIQLGTKDIADFKVGTKSVSKIMLGRELVWQKGPPIFRPEHDIFGDGSCKGSLWFDNEYMDGIWNEPWTRCGTGQGEIELWNNGIYCFRADVVDSSNFLYFNKDVKFDVRRDRCSYSFWAYIYGDDSAVSFGSVQMSQPNVCDNISIGIEDHYLQARYDINDPDLREYVAASFRLYSGGCSFREDASGTIRGQWHHFTFTYDGNESNPNIQAYIDGGLFGACNGPMDWTPPTYTWMSIMLRANVRATGFRVFNKTLDNNQIAILAEEAKEFLIP